MTTDEYNQQRDRAFELLDDFLKRAGDEKLHGGSLVTPLIATLVSTIVALQQTGSAITLPVVIAALIAQHVSATEMVRNAVAAPSQPPTLPESGNRTVH